MRGVVLAAIALGGFCNKPSVASDAGEVSDASSEASEPEEAAPDASASASVSASVAPPSPSASSVVKVGGPDPLDGKWTLADATKGLKGTGALLAHMETTRGPLDCHLYDDRAPNTVANFVGLARGTRPWKTPDGTWVRRPAYDGTPFHRVIRGFIVQGGDAKGTGMGDPGYTIADEIWPGATHNRAGLLCMANRGKNTNGAQFFLTDGAATHLDRGYTIFGECAPVERIRDISNGPVLGDRAVSPVVIKSIAITREKPPR
ncbi:MAG: peptidylprolyl isomerase [Myxococcales bacterium]